MWNRGVSGEDGGGGCGTLHKLNTESNKEGQNDSVKKTKKRWERERKRRKVEVCGEKWRQSKGGGEVGNDADWWCDGRYCVGRDTGISETVEYSACGVCLSLSLLWEVQCYIAGWKKQDREGYVEMYFVIKKYMFCFVFCSRWNLFDCFVNWKTRFKKGFLRPKKNVWYVRFFDIQYCNDW